MQAIIVVDECDLQQHEALVRSFSTRGDRLAIISLSYENGNVSPPTLFQIIGQLSADAITQMLHAEYPQMPNDVVRRLSEFSDGYPRIAILLANTYLTGGTGSDIVVSDKDLMDRLIGGGVDVKSDSFKIASRVLTGLSLFAKVGFEGTLQGEARYVAELMGVGWQDFVDEVGRQRRRGIIQGQFYLYVTPFMLRVYLLKNWWETQGLSGESLDAFVNNIPQELRAELVDRFFRHIPYVGASARGEEFTEQLLGPRGLFGDGSPLQTEIGARLFSALSEANPSAGLQCLMRTLGTWSPERLKKFTVGRREVIWALERIAVWKDLFADASRLLLALAEAENETWSNNATGVFVGLFSSAPGKVAPTEASPSERMPIIKEALESASGERRLLAIRACNSALEARHFGRMVGSEHQGLRREPTLWAPKTYGEWFDSYRLVWDFLSGSLEKLSQLDRIEAVKVLTQRARGLVTIESLSDMVLSTLETLSTKSPTDKDLLLTEVIEILHYEAKDLPPRIRSRLQKIRDVLTGNDFGSLLHRYVGLDIFVDRFDDQGNRTDRIRQKIDELAGEAYLHPKTLATELEWLVSAQTENAFNFGFALGTEDRDRFEMLPMLLDAQRKAETKGNTLFLGGYFRAIRSADLNRWEQILDSLVADPRLRSRVPELTWRSGSLTDRSGARVLHLVESGVVNIDELRMFVFGGVIRGLKLQMFNKWVDFLLSATDVQAALLALELCSMYYTDRSPRIRLPKGQTWRLLVHPSLFTPHNPWLRSSHAYDWAIIARGFMRDYPTSSTGLADKILQNMGTNRTIAQLGSEVYSMLGEIARNNPESVWDRVIKYLGPPLDLHAFEIRDWLRGGDMFNRGAGGFLSIFPANKIWGWVAKNPDERALSLASIVPQQLSREKDKPCLARDLLIRYGVRAEVRQALMSNFDTEGWSGPDSAHYQEKVDWLVAFRANEQNTNVKLWIDEYVLALKSMIKRSRAEEEKRGH